MGQILFMVTCKFIKFTIGKNSYGNDVIKFLKAKLLIFERDVPSDFDPLSNNTPDEVMDAFLPPMYFIGQYSGDIYACRACIDILVARYTELVDSVNQQNKFYFDITDIIIISIISIVPLLLGVAYFTLAERKVMAAIQRRKGPNIVGFWGLLQPIADGLKLISKEVVIPTKSNKFVFFLSPFISLFTSLLSWILLPIDVFNCICLNNYSLLFIMVLSPLGVYGVLLAGIGSNSKYAMLAAIRTAAQMVSYEIPLGLCYLCVVAVTGSTNLQGIVFYQMQSSALIFFMLPVGVIYFILCLAETNRAPFDLPEAEAELVAGYNVEYSAFPFAAFFLGEYFNILTMSAMFTTLFLSGGSWLFYYVPIFLLYQVLLIIFFSFKMVVVAAMFIFVRANLPRYRFDHLMEICWKVFVPLLLALFVFYSGVVFSADIAIEQLPPCLVQKLSRF